MNSEPTDQGKLSSFNKVFVPGLILIATFLSGYIVKGILNHELQTSPTEQSVTVVTVTGELMAVHGESGESEFGSSFLTPPRITLDVTNLVIPEEIEWKKAKEALDLEQGIESAYGNAKLNLQKAERRFNDADIALQKSKQRQKNALLKNIVITEVDSTKFRWKNLGKSKLDNISLQWKAEGLVK